MYGKLDAAKLLRALASSEKQEPGSFLPKGPTVTVSRDDEAGGEEIAQHLARHLGVRCLDKDLLEAIVQEAHVSRDLLEQLDEHVHGMLDDAMRTLMTGQHFGRENYRSCLVRVVLGVSAHGGVIVGRAANLILGARRAFRVRVVGSVDSCAQRLAGRQRIPLVEALRRVQSINAERAQFVQLHFQRDINDATAYDLSVNTDRISFTDAADVVLCMMQKAGLLGTKRKAAAV